MDRLDVAVKPSILIQGHLDEILKTEEVWERLVRRPSAPRQGNRQRKDDQNCYNRSLQLLRLLTYGWLGTRDLETLRSFATEKKVDGAAGHIDDTLQCLATHAIRDARVMYRELARQT